MKSVVNRSANDRIESFINIYQWLAHASNETLLSRSNLHFTAVHMFADAMTIVDVSRTDVWPVRLSGTKACERRGSNTTGQNAQVGFSETECALRVNLAASLFINPCGIRSKTRETYATGESAVLDTMALPMIGAKGEQLVVHYAHVLDDIHHAYGCRPTAKRTDLVSYDFVDLGHGVPSDDALRERLIA